MSDIISRADAIEAVEQAIFNHDSAIMRITLLPSADAIPIEKYHELQHQFVMLGATFSDLTEVVRCKDCRYYWGNLGEDDTDEMYGECRWDSDEMPNADDFCSYGERRQP